jgi:uncharacterized protein (DUF952 family)
VIYKLLTATEWAAAQAQGRYDGSAVDHRDGYLHFSARDQVVETGLVLLTVDPAPLGDALRWEPSRGGALFPHLYAPLPLDAVIAVDIVDGDVAAVLR